MLDSSLNMYCQLLAGVPRNFMTQMQNLLYKFITNDLTYHQAAAQCISLLGTSDPIDKIVMFTNIPEISNSSSYYNQYGSSSKVGGENPNKKSKTWTKHEDQRLLAAIHKYGFLDWNKISEFVGNGRSRSQCVQRWSRSLNPLINKTQWTKEEDEKLLRLVNKHGKRSWTKISNEIDGRTDVQCRYRYQIITKQVKKETNTQKSPESPLQSDCSPSQTENFDEESFTEIDSHPENQNDFQQDNQQTVQQISQQIEQSEQGFSIFNEMQMFDLLNEISADPFSFFNM
ncbi:Myb-like DNA-binding domain containing protein [Trichomonas vaginalis G3]|uniref:Myb-like DNA-binding domain containing protein n=1 Tax=Trichomonas vaginalis (strain ATCC PRA-98 / G3) TaxID=412133 RepID=A2FF03_TRIV3|nr:RNA polymerase II transcription regulator recruiting protein [Trichomonas vaginalis G3]EAX96507.1 Myb-like DNA-binding domain containing protein [Trichomonas vaginalis G3]KAI5506502.1 RNA polymerase II transcription regulator recruiting protein [Trichomonas vaginalis G3]|eukprot:XP_001309437.1 Myb-like DNA-binding domain containing protein [Trichomonas vaginalis G3]